MSLIELSWTAKKGFNYLTCLALPFFPIALICVKTIALFNPGPNWKILAQRFTVAEGLSESTCQFYLQLFIVFSRADRSPSSVQLLTLATSFLLLIKVRIDEVLMTQPPLDDFWRRCLRVASFLPMLITGQLSDTSLVVLLVTLLRYWALVFLLLLSCCSGCCIGGALGAALARGEQEVSGGRQEEGREEEVKRVKVGMMEMNGERILGTLYSTTVIRPSYLLVLTLLVITANVSPDSEISAVSWQVWTSLT